MNDFITSYFVKNYGVTEDKLVELSQKLSTYKVLNALGYSKSDKLLKKIDLYAVGGTEGYTSFELALMFLAEFEIESAIAELSYENEEVEDECERIILKLNDYIKFDSFSSNTLTVLIKQDISEIVMKEIEKVAGFMELGFVKN